jgi:hypothetical protein
MAKRMRWFCWALAAAAALGGCDKAASLSRGYTKFAVVTISLHPSSPAAADTRPDATDRAVLLFRVTGDPYQTTRVEKIVVTLIGTAPAASIASAKIYRDDGATPGTFESSGDTIAGTGVFLGSRASVNLTPAVSIAAGATADLFVVYDMNSGATPPGASTFGARLDSGADVTAKAAASGLAAVVNGAPVQSPLSTFVGRLRIQLGAGNPVNQYPNDGQTNVPILQLRLEAPDEPVAIPQIVITGIPGAANVSGLSSIPAVRLILDADADGAYDAGETILGPSITFSGTTATFSGLTRSVTAAGADHWLVVFDFAGTPPHQNGDRFACSLNAAGEVTANAQTSARPAWVDIAAPPLRGNDHVYVRRGSLTIALGTKTPASGNAGNASQNVLLLHFNVQETTSRENASLNQVTFRLTGGGTPAGAPATDISLVRLFRDDGDASFEPGGGASDDPVLGSSSVNASGDAAITITGGQTIAAGATMSFYAAVNLAGTASVGATFTIQLDNAGVSATGATSGTFGCTLSVTGGPVNGRTVTIVQAGTLTISASVWNPATGCVARSTANVIALGLTVALDNFENGTLTGMTLTASGTGNDATMVSSVDLWVDVNSNGLVDAGDVQLGSSATFSADDGTAAFTFSRAFTASQTEDWMAVVNFNTTAVWVGLTFRVSVAQASDVSGTGQTTGSPLIVTGPPIDGGYRVIEGIWSLISPGGTAPGARFGQLCVYDSTGGRMILFAGFGGTWPTAVTPYNDTWELTLTPGSETWTLLLSGATSPTCPSPFTGPIYARVWHDGCYDSANNQVIMTGGRCMSGTAWFNDVWALSLGATPAWTQLSPSTSPPGRALFQAAYDSTNGRMLLFGGFSTNGTVSSYYQDTWELTLGTTPAWNQITTSNDPAGRCGHSVAYDSGSGRLLILGGDSGSTTAFLQDAHTLLMSSGAWTAQANASAQRTYHKAAMDVAGKQALITGGGNLSALFNDVLCYNFPTDTWIAVTATGTAPAIRYHHSVLWDSQNNRLIVAMGTQNTGSSTSHFNDVYALN